tara:strand:- start:18860 stop:19771 length:912 start_codon:yes stop_codon:yes gene_type:complete
MSADVSILMPVFNEEKYIESAIQSIFEYNYRDGLSIELVVVDDFSEDSTYQKLKDLASQYTGVSVLKNNKKGKNSAFNLAFQASSGEYICLMGGDDKLEPIVLQKRVDTLKALTSEATYPCKVASACKIRTFSNKSSLDGIILPKKRNLGSMSGGSVMFSRALATDIFPVPDSLPNEDTWIYLYLRFNRVRILHIPEVGLHYRLHSQNSHRRGIGHKKYKIMLWERSRAALYFYARYAHRFSEYVERELVVYIAVEICIYVGSTFSIIFLGLVSVKDKIKAVFSSSPTLYKLKTKLYRYVVGR